MRMENIPGKVSIVMQYLQYLVMAGHRKGHGVHSPYVYELVSKVIFDRSYYSDYDFFRKIRKKLSDCNTTLHVEDIGAKSEYFTLNERKVSDLVRRSSVKAKFGKLLFRIAKWYNPSTIIELGTSVGLSTIYLAKGNPGAKIITAEGSTELYEFANRTFLKNNITNILLKQGMFDDLLDELAEDIVEPTLIFIDGNHQYKATLHYFNFFSERIKEGIIVLDDIHWSQNMNSAWREITRREGSQASIDLFGMGIVILRQGITRKTYTIRF